MGYTNKWKQSKDFTNAEWVKIQSDASSIVRHVQHNMQIPLEVDSDNDAIVIDEVGGDPHETFVLEQIKRDCFTFCKTGRKPYDIAVKAIMLSAKFHAPDAIIIHSNGMNVDDADGIELWLNAVELNKAIFNRVDDLTTMLKIGERTDSWYQSSLDFVRVVMVQFWSKNEAAK